MKRLIKQSSSFTSKKEIEKQLSKENCLELKNGKFLRIFYKGPNDIYWLHIERFDAKNYIENIAPEIWENEKTKNNFDSYESFLDYIYDHSISYYEYFNNKEITWGAAETSDKTVTMEDIFEDTKYSKLKSSVIIGDSFDDVINKILKDKNVIDNLKASLISKKKIFDMIKSDGYIKLDDGYYYVCCKLNEENWDFTGYESFLEQIKKEGLYNRVYASAVVKQLNSKYPVDSLPIFGDSNRWVTKWFSSDFDATIKQDFSKSSGMGLTKRVNLD